MEISDYFKDVEKRNLPLDEFKIYDNFPIFINAEPKIVIDFFNSSQSFSRDDTSKDRLEYTHINRTNTIVTKFQENLYMTGYSPEKYVHTKFQLNTYNICLVVYRGLDPEKIRENLLDLKDLILKSSIAACFPKAYRRIDEKLDVPYQGPRPMI